MLTAARLQGRPMTDQTAAALRRAFPLVSMSADHRRHFAVAGVFALAMVLCSPLGFHGTDVSWLISVGHRMWDGERLYVDVWESNPPFSVWLYLPAVALERVTGLRAEVWTSGGVFAFAAASLWLTSKILRDAELWSAGGRAVFISAMAAALLLASPAEFAQREQVGIIGATPFLTLIAARLSRDGAYQPARWIPVFAGLCGAVIMVVKPYYALGLGLPILWAAFHQHLLKFMFLREILAASAVVIGYGAAAILLYPDYLRNVLPLMAELYMPARRPFAELVWYAVLAIGPAIVGGLALSRLWKMQTPAAHVFALAALGFAISYVLSGKGWPYHALPAFVAACGVLAAIAAGADLTRRKALLIAAVALVGPGFFALSGRLGPWSPRAAHHAAATIVAIKQRPTMVVISPDIAAGNPLARTIGADWRERDTADFLPAYAQWRFPIATAEDQRRYAELIDAALARKAADLRARPIDLVILDHRSPLWLETAQAHPEIALILSDYVDVFQQNDIAYLMRRDLVEAAR